MKSIRLFVTTAEHYPQTMETTSTASCENSLDYLEKNFLRLDLSSGQKRGNCWESPDPLLGGLSMLNIGESPSVDVESSLSQILEDNVQEKYYLSQKACEGILRRAKSRGKELPERLKVALERQAYLMSQKQQPTDLNQEPPQD